MEPAASIIQKLGGPSVVSERTGTAYTAPYRWRSPVERGGTGGAIPRKYIPALLALAAEKGVALSPADFVAVPSINGGPLAAPAIPSSSSDAVAGSEGTTDDGRVGEILNAETANAHR